MQMILPVDYGIREINASVFINSASESKFTFIIHKGEYKRIRADQLWFWTEEWQEGERQVDDYIREGNIQEFNSMEGFLLTLKE